MKTNLILEAVYSLKPHFLSQIVKLKNERKNDQSTIDHAALKKRNCN
jgi:hypothetical protein